MFKRLRGSGVMVTGGCGFIGSHLVRALLQNGVERITVVDSLRYGKRENLLEAAERVTLIPFTLGTDPVTRLAEAMAGTDYLFHLAAEKHNQSKDTPDAVFQANVVGTHDLFELAATSGVKKIVFSSSLYAYGQMHAPAMVETDLPQPWTVYGISKLTGEHLLRHIKRVHGTPYTVLRYFFVYGPRQFAGLGYKSVIVKNFERIARGGAPIIFGDGEQSLDYTHVEDVVRASVLAMVRELPGDLYNVGSGEAISVKELTARMLSISGAALEPQTGPADWTAGTCRVADVARLQRDLGYQPTITLDEGLRSTYQWVLQEAK